MGAAKGPILIGSKTLGVFLGAFFKEEFSSSLTNLDWNKGGGQKGEFLSSRRLVPDEVVDESSQPHI